MKKIVILFILITGVAFPSCNKFNDDAAQQREKKLLERYLLENNITIPPTSSGLYHVIIDPGAGTTPGLDDFLIIEYTATLINGTVFDTSNEALAIAKNVHNPDALYGPFKFQLKEIVLKGLKEGLSLMRKGEKARLIIPSKLAYGSKSFGIIPPYSTLIYEVELLDIISNPVAHEESLLAQYLIDNSITVPPTSSGLYYIENQAGTANIVETGMRVVLHYHAKLLDGRVFDSTIGRIPYEFVVDQSNVIAGLNEAVKLMKAGRGKATLIIPSKIAYGATGSPNRKVPPYTTIILEIELIEAYYQ